MLFGTPVFVLAFLPATLLGVHLLSGRSSGWALAFLLGASFVFYGWDRPADLPLLAGSILVNFAIGRRIGRGESVWRVIGICANLALLALCKYAGLLGPLLGLKEIVGLPPLGISFFTFQQIMFLATCRKTPPAEAGFLPYAVFIAFFAHLIAGPLVRPGEIIPQFVQAARRGIDPERLAEGATFFLLGLAKKLVLGDLFARFADQGFDAAARGHALTLIEAWCAVLAFSLQIYFDFSGYSDMAIGLALMLGIRFPLNFASPYKARTIRDFWRRWHMTLSRFLRDFLYIPLGGNRHGEARRLANLMITMLLGGLWHGAAWRFLLWGGLHGLYLMLHEAWDRGAPRWARLPAPVAQLLTLLVVILAWVPFRAADLGSAARMLRGMAGLDGLAFPASLVALLPLLGHLGRVVPVLPALGDARGLSLPDVVTCLGLGWAIVLALPHLDEMTPRLRAWSILASGGFTLQALFFSGPATPFLYFRF